MRCNKEEMELWIFRGPISDPPPFLTHGCHFLQGLVWKNLLQYSMRKVDEFCLQGYCKLTFPIPFWSAPCWQCGGGFWGQATVCLLVRSEQTRRLFTSSIVPAHTQWWRCVCQCLNVVKGEGWEKKGVEGGWEDNCIILFSDLACESVIHRCVCCYCWHFFKSGLSVFEFGGFMNLCGNNFCLTFFFFFIFVYFAQEERNQMLRTRPQLVDTVLTREMQYTRM